MANQYRIQNASQLIKSQMASALALEGKNYKTQQEILAKIMENMRNFFGHMGEPTMKVRPIYESSPPWSEDLNNMMAESCDDIHVIYSDVYELEKTIVTSFNYSQVERKLLQNRLLSIEDKLKDFILYSDINDSQCILARDSFTDKTKVDYAKIHGTPAFIDTKGGIVTLGQSGSINRSLDASITIEKGNPLPDPISSKSFESLSSFAGKIVESVKENVNNQAAKAATKIGELINKVKTGNWGFLGDDSNGFPGNTHEATVIDYGSQEPGDDKFKLVGEENMHSDFLACIDGNPDTWFEYELCNLPEKYKRDPCKDFGFSFDIDSERQIRWDRDPVNGQLRLHVKVILRESEMINWISITPYTPPNDGAKPFDIEDIKISPDGTSAAISIFQAIERTDGISGIDEADADVAERVWSFPRQLAKTIDIQFTQSTKYDTDIGHWYYQRVTTTQTETKRFFGLYHKTESATDVQRVDGPNLPISSLGVITNSGDSAEAVGAAVTSAGAIAYGVASAVTAGVSAGVIAAGGTLAAVAAAAAPIAIAVVGVGLLIAGIVGSKQSTVVKDDIEGPILEAFRGWRHCIGIRDIKILSTKFVETSEFISTAYHSNGTIYKVSLRVNEEIPKAFNDFYPEKAYEWMKYYISTDDGLTWYRISPQGYPTITDESGNLIPEIYTINSMELRETRNNNVGYITSPSPVHDVRFKAVMTRPNDIPDAESYTPIMRDYVLKLYTEVIDA